MILALLLGVGHVVRTRAPVDTVDANTAPFFAQLPEPHPADFVYSSYATLTTVAVVVARLGQDRHRPERTDPSRRGPRT